MAEKTTTAASYITSGTMTLVGGYTVNEWLAVTGIILGIATFIVNWVYKHKHYKLEARRGGKE